MASSESHDMYQCLSWYLVAIENDVLRKCTTAKIHSPFWYVSKDSEIILHFLRSINYIIFKSLLLLSSNELSCTQHYIPKIKVFFFNNLPMEILIDSQITVVYIESALSEISEK